MRTTTDTRHHCTVCGQRFSCKGCAIEAQADAADKRAAYLMNLSDQLDTNNPESTVYIDALTAGADSLSKDAENWRYVARRVRREIRRQLAVNKGKK